MARKFKRSPAGIAQYAYLTTPDTKYNAEGDLKTNLILDPADAGVSDFLAAIDDLVQQSLAKALEEEKAPAKKRKIKAGEPPYFEELDNDTGEPTGRVVVKFKSKYSGTNAQGKQWTRTLPFFDSKGVKIAEDQRPAVFGGSTIRVSYDPFMYCNKDGASVTLRLGAVQIIELAANSASAEDYGFGEEEGGYEAPEDSPAATAPGASDEPDLDNDDF